MDHFPSNHVLPVCLSRRNILKGLTGLIGLAVAGGNLSACSTPTLQAPAPSPVATQSTFNLAQNPTVPEQVTPTPTANIVSSGVGIIHLYASFSFDLGKEVNSGADILWTDAPGRYTVWQVDETKLANIGVVDFDALDLAYLQKLNYSKYRLLDGASGLADGDVFAIATTRGNRAKVLIVSIADNLQIRWVTYRCLC